MNRGSESIGRRSLGNTSLLDTTSLLKKSRGLGAASEYASGHWPAGLCSVPNTGQAKQRME